MSEHVQLKPTETRSGTESRTPVDQGAARPTPPMRVVTKGWWTLREQAVSVDELQKADKNDP